MIGKCKHCGQERELNEDGYCADHANMAGQGGADMEGDKTEGGDTSDAAM